MRITSWGTTALAMLAAQLAATAQSGREMRVMAPAVIGQTAAFALRHPVAAAGNGYAMLFAAPSFPDQVQFQLPGLTVVGQLRVDPQSMVVVATGVINASGQTPSFQISIPNAASLAGFTFDMQGVDISGTAITFSDNDVAVTVANPPGPDMVPIAAGSFRMGSSVTPLGAWPYINQPQSQPVHSVTITRPFWMGRNEVTQAEWQAVMGTNPSRFVGAQRPVEQVSWDDALLYCSLLTVAERAAGRMPTGYAYRLPTEAEWEYCCRAGTTTEYSFGATIGCGQANIGINFHTGTSCSLDQTANAGTYPANAFGLEDMHGNVSEWCLDSWDFMPNYPAGGVVDPLVTSGPYRVYRGGDWTKNSNYCRSAYRLATDATARLDRNGFRVVLAPIDLP